jgi:hypothetical protein
LRASHSQRRKDLKEKQKGKQAEELIKTSGKRLK